MNHDLMQAIISSSHRDPEPALDLLLESGATLKDVLLAYAGEPPWDIGLSKDVLVEWLSRQTPPDDRAEKVKDCWVCEVGEMNVRWHCYDWSSKVFYTVYEDERTAKIHLKQCVLLLFPEVENTRRVYILDKDIFGIDQNGHVFLQNADGLSPSCR